MKKEYTKELLVTLEQAKKWYNSSNPELKDTALKLFPEESLTGTEYTKIKTFEEACNYIGLSEYTAKVDIDNIRAMQVDDNTKEYLIAVYKLSIIQQALNDDWKFGCKDIKGVIPEVWIHSFIVDAERQAKREDSYIHRIRINDRNYYLVGGSCSTISYIDSLSRKLNFISNILICKNENIARHMSNYFAKEIFYATYK